MADAKSINKYSPTINKVEIKNHSGEKSPLWFFLARNPVRCDLEFLERLVRVGKLSDFDYQMLRQV
ncbi:MAG: hypothetical protein HZB51_30140 [Chloroflexi bacterium]|nr:hypothetical protein [Chloroflexota bacterium]